MKLVLPNGPGFAHVLMPSIAEVFIFWKLPLVCFLSVISSFLILLKSGCCIWCGFFGFFLVLSAILALHSDGLWCGNNMTEFTCLGKWSNLLEISWVKHLIHSPAFVFHTAVIPRSPYSFQKPTDMLPTIISQFGWFTSPVCNLHQCLLRMLWILAVSSCCLSNIYSIIHQPPDCLGCAWLSVKLFRNTFIFMEHCVIFWKELDSHWSQCNYLAFL